jgi:hypothetical protein
MAEGWREILSVWVDLRAWADEYLELDEQRVLVLSQFSGCGKTSGLELTQMRAKAAQLFHISGGKVTRFVLYFDRERALADLATLVVSCCSRGKEHYPATVLLPADRSSGRRVSSALVLELRLGPNGRIVPM